MNVMDVLIGMSVATVNVNDMPIFIFETKSVKTLSMKKLKGMSNGKLIKSTTEKGEKMRSNLKIEGGQIIFKNFSGKGSAFNREGDRNFCVVIDEALANDLKFDGWNVKPLKKRDEDEDQRYILQVKVNVDGDYPPKIYMITGRKKTVLEGDEVGELDFANVTSCDLIISPFEWQVNGKTGIKAYLKTLYAVCEVDEFANKYDFNPDEIDHPF